MHIFPNSEEIDAAADLLVNRYDVSMQQLGALFGTEQRDQANEVLKKLGNPSLSKLDIARLLIYRVGPGLFGGSQEPVRNLRRDLLKQLPPDKLEMLFETHKPANSSISSPPHMVKPLSEKKWHAGGPWPHDFVQALGFPYIFAGVVQKDTVGTIEDVEPMRKPPRLVEYQECLKSRMKEVLNRDGDKTRCVVTLPTGGGKTRVAVEAFIDWMQPRFSRGEYLIWVAQSEELCEQAIACIREMWNFREFVSPLRIYRYFGGRDLPLAELRGGAVVTCINQLHNRIKTGDEALDNILRYTGAMIIDEAHRAVSPMYDGLLRRAEAIRGPGLFPICGLTATPGRAGLHAGDETKTLVSRFEAYLIKPDLGAEYETNPLLYFRDRQYLAKAHHIVHRSGIDYTLTDSELAEMGDGNELNTDRDLPSGFRKRLADDRSRNLVILNRLLAIPNGTPTIVYACTVEHAYFLSVILTTRGRRAGAISSETPLTLRRGLIQDFKEGKLDFLCNYGVLTTGFDAPKTACIVICRPTTSEILYEQIVGRGLRGPTFGGTETCDIIDFSDNISRLGQPLAYARFEDFWTTVSDEG